MSVAPKVVLDTNVVLSALLFRDGVAGQLRNAWQRGACRPLVSTATAQELMRVLAYPKFKLSADDQHEVLADYLPFTTAVRLPSHAPPTPACRDAFDVPFLQLAVVGKAWALVTGDQDLLTLNGQLPCPILKITACLENLPR